MNKFELHSNFKPQGDQIKAIKQLTKGVLEGKKHQVLLGATGTGKTFTISNVIANVNKPTLIFVHNKTLAAQLYIEFKEFFPNNHVEYFVSNFDFYQPEAYIPSSDTYIDKNSTTNDELDMLRMAAYNAALSHKDTIIVASVACIYGAGNPNFYREMFFTLKIDQKISREEIFNYLVQQQYTRNNLDLKRGTFRSRGDSIEIALAHSSNIILRIELFDDVIERIVEVDASNNHVIQRYQLYVIAPANGYVTKKETIKTACQKIRQELEKRLEELKSQGKELEAQRLSQRVSYDVDALEEFGICPGIENYSRFLDGRAKNETPYTLLDYFPKDFLLVVDESHVSLPQIKGMFNGDRSRKQTLVDYGFRLPSALDNRPLRIEEFLTKIDQAIYVSATPGEKELEFVNHQVVEQIIRPTGLLDPIVEVHKSEFVMDDLMDELTKQVAKKERTMITALTVRMAEELTKYLKKHQFKVVWIHHEVTTIERSEIIQEFRSGKYDVLIGINLLREGLDIPEVSLVCILDADKEGFLRNTRSLIQTIGRAARNENGRVILYADKISPSMEQAIQETNRRRKIQMEYNEKHGIIPKTIRKKLQDVIHSKENKKVKTKRKKYDDAYILELQVKMKEAAKRLDFEEAARYRDELKELVS